MKKKLKLTVFILLGLACEGLKAQQAVTTAGGNATGSGGSVSYSVGQIADNLNTGSNGSENQGVQQPYEFFITSIDENKNITLVSSAYPNPTASSVNLKVDNQKIENLIFQLYDISGNLILSQKINSNLTSISMETFAAATYILKVTDNQTEVQSFKIIKNK